MDSLPALESEKSDFLSAPAPEVVPKAQEAESMPEIKSGSHPSAQRPGRGEGEGSLTSPHPCGLGRDTAGQEVHADGPPPPEEENWAVENCRLTMLSLEQDRQGNLSHPGDSSIEVTASERLILNILRSASSLMMPSFLPCSRRFIVGSHPVSRRF